MKLSIVSTLYYSAAYIDDFYKRIRAVVDPITRDYEFVFVNDGSLDNSLDVALQLRIRDNRVRVVDLSRNFGHHKAMMTGLEHAQGDLIFLIDVDLEEPPEALTICYGTLIETPDADVVYGVQGERLGSFSDRVLGGLFYQLFNLLSSDPVPRDPLTLRLMTRRYVDQLLRHREHRFSIEALWAITGFKQIPLEINKTEREGASTYTWGKKLSYVLNAITAFSNKPLIFISVLGILMTIPAGVYILIILYQYFVLGYRVDGWSSMIVSLWFLGGLIILILGIIALYLSVIFVEIKNRPYTIVRHVYDTSDSAKRVERLTEPQPVANAAKYDH
ncbi:MAG: glycosyltransferase family 2 protein [Burkholderiales bacterium]|nr:glycosyltransferase family 2 protein [Anaerolineae bacterium]